MTAPIPGDVEAAVERLTERINDLLAAAVRHGDNAADASDKYDAASYRADADDCREHAADIATLLASHAAMAERAKADGEALRPFAAAWDQITAWKDFGANIDTHVSHEWGGDLRSARARLQAREGGGS